MLECVFYTPHGGRPAKRSAEVSSLARRTCGPGMPICRARLGGDWRHGVLPAWYVDTLSEQTYPCPADAQAE